jgi:hypothetical protein
MHWHDLWPGAMTCDPFADFKVKDTDGEITRAILAGEAYLLLEALEHDPTVDAFRLHKNWAIPIIPPKATK